MSTARLLQPPPDGLLLMAGLRESIDTQLSGLTAQPGRARTADVDELLLTLELRCKLEEQLLLPALYAVQGDACWYDAKEEELDTLRDLAARVHAAPPDLALQRVLLLSLQGLLMLHFDAVDRLSEHHRNAIDRQALGRQVQGHLDRWRFELRQNGLVPSDVRGLAGSPQQ